MTQRWTLEIRVGSFIIAGLVLLVVFIFTIGDLSTYFQSGYRLRVLFPSANGITEGSPVQYAGIEIGKVHRVNLVYLQDQPRPQVELQVRVPSFVTIRKDDEAAISTFGLLGEKYLEVTPGSGTGDLLGPEDLLVGKPPVSTEQLIDRSDEVLTELKRTLEGVNQVVADPESRAYLAETLQELRDATRNWRTLGERLNVTFSYTEQQRGTLGKLLYDDELYERLLLFVEDLREHPWKLLTRPKHTRDK